MNAMGIRFYIYLSIGLIFASIMQVLTIYVIYYFSPILITVTDSISPMLFWILISIIKGIESNNYKNIILISIGYFIQLIAGLIYNEIIICNFCDLNKKTKKFLMEKQRQESDSLILSENSFENEKIN